MLGQIVRAFHFRDRYVFVQLYTTYVRPNLEFEVQAWSPCTVADMPVLEQVQKRAIRMVSGLRGREYEDRLAELGLTTLKERRHQADRTMNYRIVTRKDDVDLAEWFTMATQAARVTGTAADPLNVIVKHGRLDVRRNFFSVRVTEDWNKVPSANKKNENGGRLQNCVRETSREYCPCGPHVICFIAHWMEHGQSPRGQ